MEKISMVRNILTGAWIVYILAALIPEVWDTAQVNSLEDFLLYIAGAGILLVLPFMFWE
tara:strand:+ start:298 stop:474 length:177 start_codon:yes stop_codon:yes gene_type:complete